MNAVKGECQQLEEKEQRIKNILRKKREIEEKRQLQTFSYKAEAFQTVASSARADLSLSNGTLLLRTTGSCKKLTLGKSPSHAHATIRKEQGLAKNPSVRLLNEILRSADAKDPIDISTPAKNEGLAFPNSDRVWECPSSLPLKQREFFKRIENDCMQRRQKHQQAASAGKSTLIRIKRSL